MLEEEMKLCTQHHLLTLFQCSHLKEDGGLGGRCRVKAQLQS